MGLLIYVDVSMTFVRCKNCCDGPFAVGFGIRECGCGCLGLMAAVVDDDGLVMLRVGIAQHRLRISFDINW